MTTISNGDLLKIVVTMAFGDSHVVQNVFAAIISGGGGPWDVIDVLDDLDVYLTAVYDNITSIIDDGLDGTDIDAFVYDPIDDDFDDIGNEPWGWTPTSNGAEMPRGVAALVVAPTTDPDVQGKKYIGGLTEELFTGGVLTGAALTAIINWATDWIDPFTGSVSGATYTPGVWSTILKDVIPFRDSFSTNAIAAYQRRRKRGVGI